MNATIKQPRRPDITFHRSGQINISAHLVRLLSLRQHDTIDVAHEDGETYIYVRCRAPYNGSMRAACYRASRNGLHMRCQCITLYRSIAVHTNRPTAPSIALYAGEPVQHDGKTFIPLITHNPITP